MPRKKRKGGFRKRTIAIVLGAGVLSGGLAFALTAERSPISLEKFHEKLRSERFRLSRVEFIGLNAVLAEDLLARAEIPKNVPLIDLDLAYICERVKSHPRISDCTATRLFPDRLVLGVEERIPLASVVNKKTGFDVNANLFVLTPEEIERLPQVNGDPQHALPLLALASEFQIEIQSIDARKPDDLRFQPRDRTLEIRVGADPRASLLDWLRLRESGLLQGYAAQEVDLRFPGSTVLRRFQDLTEGEKDGST